MHSIRSLACCLRPIWLNHWLGSYPAVIQLGDRPVIRTGGLTAWTGKVRGSLVRLDDKDGKLVFDLLQKQSEGGEIYALDTGRFYSNY